MAKTRTVSDETLVVNRELIGCELATPGRRLAGALIDGLILIVPSIAVSVTAAALALSLTHPNALTAIQQMLTQRDGSHSEVVRNLAALAPLLVEIQAPGVPPSVAVAVQKGDDQEAAEQLAEYDFMFSLSGAEELAPPGPGMVRVEVGQLIPRAFRGAALFGTAALYFTFFASGKRRATIGKRLMKTEVRKLDGKDLSVYEAFERFGGYLVALGTFGLGLLDLWRDPHRRLAHDRISNTVVVKRLEQARLIESRAPGEEDVAG